ncbi:MAG: helicase C-terminal domain-containing protein [Opitutaceae bacterium]
MNFDLDQRSAALGAGEFAGFTTGPAGAGADGGGGLWRAQLGTRWHQELRTRAAAAHGAAARFEVGLSGTLVHRGWRLTLTGRVDQFVPGPAGATLREVKSVLRPLPADPAELRAEHPAYFIQLATYAALLRLGLAAPAPEDPPLPAATAAELVFVEAGTGLLQAVPLDPADEAAFRAQLDRVADFLELRLRARNRLRGLRFQAAFATPRPGQERTVAELTALFERHPLVCFEAPTGFGKTGVLLEFGLGQLRTGHFDRLLYLTSKATGQLQVVQTLAAMRPPDAPGGSGPPVAVWHVRNKGEHCINAVFHCVREACPHLADPAGRWERGGLARFHRDEHHARDLEALRAAGREAGVCPYEITRTALAFHDVWIGDYNYVFAPRSQGLFAGQPGYDPARTLLVVDEAHNLPARAADALSHACAAADAFGVREELHRIRPGAALVQAWDHWCHFLHRLPARDALPAHEEDDARHLLGEIAAALRTTGVDFAALGPTASAALWAIPALLESLDDPAAPPRLWWSPAPGRLLLTCLDAAKTTGQLLRGFGGVVLASATLRPLAGFAAACGLAAPPAPARAPSSTPAPERLGQLTKRDTRRLFRQLTNAAALLREEARRDAATPQLLAAHAPWRDGAYDVACDLRVDTRYQQRGRHHGTTAATAAALHRSAGGPVAVFFPSYAYAEAVREAAEALGLEAPLTLQPRGLDLAAQSAWIATALDRGEILGLILGSSFAEGIDALGGRVRHALVAGPALPEVNPVQKARMEEALRTGIDRDTAFRQVYQGPGMTKVNQALGRLVRAPGHQARILLHCRRFAEPAYAELLAPAYQGGATLATDADLAAWLARPPHPATTSSPRPARPAP